MCADVGQVEVIRVELPFGDWCVQLVISNAAMTHNERIDAEVDG